MNQLIGSISEFNSGRDDWDVYHERLEQFFEVNEVPAAKQSAFLISVIGADSYKSLRDLCHPYVPKDKPFAELCELLRKQFSPQVSVFRERAKFYNARHENHENVTQWYGRLKRLSVDCKFGENLEAILLDKFITGLRPGQVLDRLCEENEKLKLDQALDIAVNKECAAKESAFAPARVEPRRGPFCGGFVPPHQRNVLFGGQPVTCSLPANPQPLGGFSRPQPPSPAFGSSGLGKSCGVLSDPPPFEASACTFGSAPQPKALFSAGPALGSAAAPTNNLFGSSLQANDSAEPQALAFGAPMKRIAAQHSLEPVSLDQQLELECSDAPAAAAAAIPAAEDDGVPPGANRVRAGRRVRTRRRGRGHKGTSGDAADNASVDGEKDEV